MFEKVVRQSIFKCRDYIPGKPVEEVQRELGITDIVKMASNENPLGASPKAIQAMQQELVDSSNRYPESLCVNLAAKLAEIHGIDTKQIFIDNGLDGVITMIGLTFINPEDEIIFGELTFPAYGNITRKMGGTSVEIPLTAENKLDLDAFAKAVTNRTKIIFICNPNNPTGVINTKDEVEKLLAAVPQNVLVVLDEAYYDYADDAGYPKSLAYLKQYQNVIVLRTFSKIMGLAALRVGYAMACEEIIKYMLKAREPFPVNRIAQAGALASLDDHEFVEATLKVNTFGKEQYYKAFTEMGLKYYPSQTNFIYVELGRPAAEIFDRMLRDGVIVRPMGSQNRPEAMRITVGTAEQNERTILALKKAMSK